MSKFAKLFEHEELGQILVKIGSSDEDQCEAEVRIFFKPKGLGVCSSAFNYDDWDKADEAFEMLTEELAITIVSEIMNKFSDITTYSED